MARRRTVSPAHTRARSLTFSRAARVYARARSLALFPRVRAPALTRSVPARTRARARSLALFPRVRTRSLTRSAPDARTRARARSLAGVRYGTVYWQQNDIRDIASCCFFSVQFMTMSSLQAVPQHFAARALFERERAAGVARELPYLLARWLVGFALQVCCGWSCGWWTWTPRWLSRCVCVCVRARVVHVCL